MIREACLDCKASLACVCDLAWHRFLCYQCNELFVQIPGGTISISRKAALDCTLVFSNGSKMDIFGRDCCNTCADTYVQGDET